MNELDGARSCMAVILAAGEGTRMQSARPKVLHEVAGRSMLGHVLAAVRASDIGRCAVVIGPDREDVRAEALRSFAGVECHEQRERWGTAHAVLAARASLEQPVDDVLILFGDTPLIEASTIAALRQALAGGAHLAVLGFEAKDPTGYGRLVMVDGSLVAIREHKDASAAERGITLCNGGLMAIDGSRALALLDKVGNANAQKEFYLTDLVQIARTDGLVVRVIVADETQILGINDRVQLAGAEALMQARLRETAMRSGVTMTDPASVFLSHDTKFARDVRIEPNVVFGTGVEVGAGSVIHAFSHLAGALVGDDCSIGPYARLRPGTRIERGGKIGNFVETKAARIGEGAKISHLSYIGDATIGADANIGAGTITCNYDGFTKFQTIVGAGAFVGSNSSLVAPVSIGAGAYVASGSVVTADVAPDALAVARSRQVDRPGWAVAFRNRQPAKKK